MSPFSREPLKEFIEQTYYVKSPQPNKGDSSEDIVFSLLVSIFLIGVILFSGQQPTALVSYETNTDVININTIYNESTNLSLTLEGIPTSLRLTGQFIGNGTGIIILDQYIAVEKDQLPISEGISLTGFVVFENDTNSSNENITLSNINIIEENETVELVENITNVTLNETIPVNTTENLTIIPNITLNVTENITTNISLNISIVPNVTINITQNITEVNETENITITSQNVTIEIRDFEDYCLETCFLNDIPPTITLLIELDNVILNLSHITYTYQIEEEIIDIIPPIVNVTDKNVTTNVTDVNITFNETINLTTIKVNVSNITSLENALQQRGLQLFNYSYTDNLYKLTIGESNRNYAIVNVADLSDFVLNFVDSQDRRINSKLFLLNNTDAELYLETDDPDVLLQCVQYSDTCKRWQISNVPYSYDGSTLQTNLTSGIYAAAALNRTAKEYVASDYVNMNSNCWGCIQESYCNYLGFTPVTNQGRREFAFQGQLGFNILDVAEDFTNVEVCAYVTYLYNDTATVNYVKNSEISYCGNPDKNYVPSNHVSYAVIDKEDEWVCIPITEILQYNIGQGYSDMFLDWLGEDLNGKAIPFAMYEGMHELKYCEGYNPSGANDCRPYLKLSYK